MIRKQRMPYFAPDVEIHHSLRARLWMGNWVGLSSAWSLATGAAFMKAGLVGARPGWAERMLAELAAEELLRRAEVLGTALFSNKQTFRYACV